MPCRTGPSPEWSKSSEGIRAELEKLKPTTDREEMQHILRVLGHPRCRKPIHSSGLFTYMVKLRNHVPSIRRGSPKPFPKTALNTIVRELLKVVGYSSDEGGSSQEYVPTDPEDIYQVSSSNSDNPDETDGDTEVDGTEDGEIIVQVISTNCVRVTRSNTKLTPTEVAEHKAPAKIKIERIRWGAVQDQLEDIRNRPGAQTNAG